MVFNVNFQTIRFRDIKKNNFCLYVLLVHLFVNIFYYSVNKHVSIRNRYIILMILRICALWQCHMITKLWCNLEINIENEILDVRNYNPFNVKLTIRYLWVSICFYSINISVLMFVQYCVCLWISTFYIIQI